ncbi:MAG TPA: CHAD domain-containing protein [Acidimicrobiales bacterium]|nr:CHAD domain-containing protein [Acidimicrobiales bacterium]
MRERELKLDLPVQTERPTPAELAAAVPGCRAVELTEVVQLARYLDSPDLRLLRAGATLRHRDDEGWMVKLPSRGAGGAGLDREEVRFEGPDHAVPDAARELVAPLLRAAELEEVARLRTVRRRARIIGDGGRLLVELTLDSVEATRPAGADEPEVSMASDTDEGADDPAGADEAQGHDDPDADAGVDLPDGHRLAGHFAEAELEVGALDLDDLDDLVALLRQRGAGDPVGVPKLVRALGDPGPPDVVVADLDADATVREAVTAAIARSVAQLLRELPWVLLDVGPEPVHQARVATRRLRSDLRTFRRVLDADWAAARRQELSRLADALGAVRDADVLGMRLRDHATVIDDRHRAALDVVLARLDAERSRAWGDLRPVIVDRATTDLLDHLVEAARAPHVAPDVADRPATEVLPSLVSRPWRHLVAAVDGLDADPPDDALHDIRIRAKRCRYAAEAIDPALGGAASRFADAAATLQDRLGVWHDAVVAAEWLEATAAEVDPPVAFVAGLLARGELDDAGRLRERWAPAYARLAAPKRRRWMPDPD